MKELRETLASMANGKASGTVGIPTELLKEGGEKLKKELLILVQKIWIEKSIPTCRFQNS